MSTKSIRLRLLTQLYAATDSRKMMWRYSFAEFFFNITTNTGRLPNGSISIKNNRALEKTVSKLMIFSLSIKALECVTYFFVNSLIFRQLSGCKFFNSAPDFIQLDSGSSVTLSGKFLPGHNIIQVAFFSSSAEKTPRDRSGVSPGRI